MGGQETSKVSKKFLCSVLGRGLRLSVGSYGSTLKASVHFRRQPACPGQWKLHPQPLVIHGPVVAWCKGPQRKSPVTEARKRTERSCISSAGWPPEVSVTTAVQGPR